MSEITDKRVSQRVKRKNNKTLKKYPLFFEEFKTDFDTEKKALIDIEESNRHFWIRQEKLLKEAETKVIRVLRYIVRNNLKDGVKEILDRHSRRKFHDAHYLLDALYGNIARLKGMLPVEVAYSFNPPEPAYWSGYYKLMIIA